MNIAHLSCAMALFALVLDAAAAESPVRVGSSAEAADMAHASASSVPRRDPASTQHGLSGRSNGMAAGTGLRSSGPAPRGPTALARNAADRPHSPHHTEARRGAAKVMSRPVEREHAASTVLTASAWKRLDANPVVRPKLSISNDPARTLSRTVPRGSTIGGPRVAGPARVGGPATGRAANPAVIDGTQLHRKF